MNCCNFTGRMVADPVLKETDDGSKYVNFDLAVQPHPRSKGAEATFIRCVAWDTAAEIIADRYRKGRPISITSSLQTSKWEKDGKKHWRHFYRVESFWPVPIDHSRKVEEEVA